MSSTLSGDVDYARLLTHAPDPYLVLAPNPPRFTIQDASDSYLELTQTSRHRLVGQTRAVGTFRYDIPIHDSDDEERRFAERYWSPRNVPVFDEDGALIHILHRLENVTDFVLRARIRRRDARGGERPDESTPLGRAPPRPRPSGESRLDRSRLGAIFGPADSVVGFLMRRKEPAPASAPASRLPPNEPPTERAGHPR